MPLHLLGKKSWNVYNTDNIARVRADEALLAAHEEEIDRILQDHDAAKRLALLRGQTPPRTPDLPPAPDFSNRDRKRTHESEDHAVAAIESPAGGRERKKCRLAGEDDTDRDIRLARVQREDAVAAKERLAGKKPERVEEAPLYDTRGHMNLFAVSEKDALRAQKEATAAEEKLKKKEEAEQVNSMRFSAAAGRDGMDRGPWYVEKGATRVDKAEVEEADEVEGKNVWGRPDPRRKVRDAQRVSSSDPLAFMKKAQVQLKQAEKDRKSRAEERWKEERELKEAAQRHRRIQKRRSTSVDGLDGFHLDAPARKDREVRNRDRDRRHHEEKRRRRSRSRSPRRKSEYRRDHRSYSDSHRDSHRRHRSRSRERDHHHRHREKSHD